MKLPIPALATGALALALLTGCTPGASSVALGEAQEIQVADEDSGTDATVRLTVTEVEQQTIDLLSDFRLDEEDLAKTPYLVHYRVELVEGELGEYDMFRVPFVVTRDTVYLGATDADGDEATPLLLIGGLDGCSGVGGEELDALGAGESLEGCRVFLADTDQGLRSVSYGTSSWSVAGAA